jgi:beta-lactamase class A
MLVRLCLLAAPVLCAQPGVIDLLENKTTAQIDEYARTVDAVVGVAAIDLTSGRTIAVNGNVVFPQASSIKIPIMIEAFRAARAGKFNLADRITLTAGDSVGGSGRIQNRLKEGPVSISVQELIREMIESSDNTATNRLIAMTGMDAVNSLLEGVGLRQTRLRRIMMDSTAASRDEENVSTPIEMARLMEMIFRNQFLDSAAMIEILKLVKADMRLAVPESVSVAAKPGELNGVRCETGLVYLPGRPFALSVMSSFLGTDKSPVADITRIVYAHFERVSRSNRYGNRVR